MGLSDTFRDLCCTGDGLYRLKKLLCMCIGTLVITSSVFSLINIFNSATNWIETIRSMWNFMFGVLMLLHEFHYTSWIRHLLPPSYRRALIDSPNPHMTAR